MRLDCRSMTSHATGGDDDDSKMASSHAREELNEAIWATKNSKKSSSSVDNDMLFSTISGWWSTSMAIANRSFGVRASIAAGSSMRASIVGCKSRLTSMEGGLIGGETASTGQPGARGGWRLAGRGQFARDKPREGSPGCGGLK
jgi:hypothetical protein